MKRKYEIYKLCPKCKKRRIKEYDSLCWYCKGKLDNKDRFRHYGKEPVVD